MVIAAAVVARASLLDICIIAYSRAMARWESAGIMVLEFVATGWPPKAGLWSGRVGGHKLPARPLLCVSMHAKDFALR